jgi:hypothetical protein
MSQLVLTLTNGLTYKELYFDIFETNIAKKWQVEVRKNYTIYENDRFINWTNNKKNKDYYINELNKQIHIVDNYSPNTIPFFFQADQVNQNTFNILHKFFEDTRGPIEDPPEFYRNAPYEVQEAINRFNIMIHEFESCMFNEQLNNKHPESRLVVTFNDRVRYDLAEEDYKYFTLKWVFGDVYVNYCEVGKTILDIIKDKDTHVGNSNIRPQRHYSADFQVKFAPTISDKEYDRRMQWFNIGYNNKKDFFENLGFPYNDKLSVGFIPVASLNRNDSNFIDITDHEIINSLSDYDKVVKTEIKE